MNPIPEDRQLGEYRLKELLHENAISRTWLAEQVSVSRLVLVDELRAQAADQRDAFLAEVRAKAAVDHPLIGSVYEAVAEPDLCFYAHELLAGTTLAQRLAEKRIFHSVRQLVPGPAPASRRGFAAAVWQADGVCRPVSFEAHSHRACERTQGSQRRHLASHGVGLLAGVIGQWPPRSPAINSSG